MTKAPLLSLEQGLTEICHAMTPIAGTETLPLERLLDRVLSEPIQAKVPSPPEDNAAMDGFALRASDAHRPLRLVGQSLAGHPFDKPISPGECVRITTGAPIPRGADAVVMQENTYLERDRVVITRTPQAGDHIRRIGEDTPAGATVLGRGHRLGPIDVSLLASLGQARAQVHRPLIVALLSTGDELVTPGQPLAPGQIYDSNRYGLAAMLRRMNARVLDFGRVPDCPDALRDVLAQARDQADAVVTSGGVSVGEADYVKQVLDELGEIQLWKLAIKPGKPIAFGRLGESWFFGLPGNPVSALVTLHQVALPALRLLAGESRQAVLSPLTLSATAATEFRKRPGRREFQRGWLSHDHTGTSINSAGPQGSGQLCSLAKANGFAVLEESCSHIKKGDPITAIPFDRFIG